MSILLQTKIYTRVSTSIIRQCGKYESFRSGFSLRRGCRPMFTTLNEEDSVAPASNQCTVSVKVFWFLQ